MRLAPEMEITTRTQLRAFFVSMRHSLTKIGDADMNLDRNSTDSEISSALKDFVNGKKRTSKQMGFFYVVRFNTGLMKIGISRSNPESRIQSHKQTAKISGASIDKVRKYHVDGCDVLEGFCVQLLKEASISREWFVSGDFDFVDRVVGLWILCCEQPSFLGGLKEKREVLLNCADQLIKKSCNPVEISRHGHEWGACLKFAKSLSLIVLRDESTPRFLFENVRGSSINMAELMLWMLLYESSPDDWFEFADMAKNAPGEVLMYAKEMMDMRIDEYQKEWVI